jgi:hypothetical protein
MLREVRPVGKDGILFALRPRTPRVGQLAKVVIKAAPMQDDLVEAKAYEIAMNQVTVYALDRSQDPVAERFTLAPLPEKGAYSFAMVIKKNVDHRVLVSLTLPGGRDVSATFEFATDPELREEKKLPGLDEKGHLDMAAQHDTMTAMGEHWTEAWREVSSKRPDWKKTAEHVGAVRTLQKNLVHFHLHKFVERKAEFDVLSEEFGRRLDRLAESIQARDSAQAVKRFERVDQYSCLKCHLVFRWGTIKEFSQIPELSHEPKD